MWAKIKGENTIGTKGSEGGIIVKDEEHILGARITLEKCGDIAPYSITVGVYGLFCHTVFMGTSEDGEAIFKNIKAEIDGYLNDSENVGNDWVENFVNRY